jgi:GntR family transcriptional regulator
MRAITIDLESDVPVYRQIADEIRGLVARGLVATGEELPSVRQLGAMLGVNLNTVAKAYRLLADEGLIDLKQGASARVTSADRPQAVLRLEPEVERKLHELFSRWVLKGAEREQIEALLAESLDSFFRAARRRKGKAK